MSKNRVIDPDNVPETFAAGPFNCSIVGEYATLTFTHMRPDAEKLLAGATSQVVLEAVVRARVVLTIDGLESLRNSIDTLLRDRQALSAAIPGRGH